MSYFYSHFNTALSITTQYDGTLPLASFLKSFFSNEKKFGSRDRKAIGGLCYNYYRCATALFTAAPEERLLLSTFICNEEANEMLAKEMPLLAENITASIEKKLEKIGIEATSVFPFNAELSDGIDVSNFNLSFLSQPDLFIRVRPDNGEVVREKLKAAQVDYRETSKTCLAFANGTKLQNILAINREAVIQDLNSQKTGDLLLLAANPEKQTKVWDCCAASGGKSLLAFDILVNIQLTVSDTRQSILYNLKNRFREAGIKDYSSFEANATDKDALKKKLNGTKFDLIICDAPCSGSGTWSRTPEQLLFFKKEEIARYSHLQKNIVANTIPYLENEGFFLYITCSVFKKENEGVAAYIENQFKLEPVKMELLAGYDKKGDSMFAALFKKV